MKKRIGSITLATVALAALTFVSPTAAQAANSSYDITITSNATDAIAIKATVFRPATADTQDVPMILHSHGWGGSRSKTGFTDWLNDGFGVLSFDQRGFGESQGQPNVQDPNLEALDVDAIIDYVATLDWVALDAPGDPVLGAIGGSYGGGYQTMSALTEQRDKDFTRFNAIAPETSWYDLPNSLGPEGVVRSLWTTALFAAAANRVPQFIQEGFAVGLATGSFPDGSVPGTVNLKEIFYSHSPASFVDAGIQLDIPVLVRQGASDNLFNLNQGIRITENITTGPSFLVGYNGGHVLPDALPLDVTPAGDACSGLGGFGALSREFFKRAFAQTSFSNLLPARYNITSATNATSCISTQNFLDEASADIADPIVALSAVAGPAQQIKIADGPLTVAGITHIRATLTTLGLDTRAFFGLSIGATPATATLVHNNVLPVREKLPVLDKAIEFELAGVGVQVPLGQSLYLTVTSTTAQFAGYGSRTPGVMLFEDVTVRYPHPALDQPV